MTGNGGGLPGERRRHERAGSVGAAFLGRVPRVIEAACREARAVAKSVAEVPAIGRLRLVSMLFARFVLLRPKSLSGYPSVGRATAR